MKLRNSDDRIFFLADLGRLDLMESLGDSTEEIPDELFEMWIKRRRPLITGLVDFRKSQVTKQQWRSSRWKFLRGIRRYQRSIAGKRMHRTLARFMATRIMRPHLNYLKHRYESLDPLQFDALKALSSYKTHLYIEGDYYKRLEEEAEYFSLLEYSIPLLNTLEFNLYKNSDADLSEDEQELLLRLVDDRELSKAFAEILEVVSMDHVFELYEGVQQRMLTDGSSRDETYFFSHLLENFLPCLLELYEKTKDPQ
jgi:hypothetical protein